MWYNLGLNNIGHLVRGTRWLTLNEIHNLSNHQINYLEYLSILYAVPKEWRKQIKTPLVNDDQTEAISTLRGLINKDKPATFIRRGLARQRCIIPTARLDNWLKELECNVDQEDWLNNLANSHKVCRATRLKSFAYRFNIRDVLTNNRLFNMNLKPSKMCYICKSYTETITHLYWECLTNRRLWERLKVFLKNTMGYDLELNPVVCLLGISNNKNYKYLPQQIQFCLIIMKLYIHDCKCQETFPVFSGFINKIKWFIQIERSIEIREKGEGKKVKEKWGEVLNYLEGQTESV